MNLDRTAAVVLRTGGWVFCIAWTFGLLWFPVIKHAIAGYVPLLAGLALGVALLVSGQLDRFALALSRIPRGRFLVALLTVAALLRLAAIVVLPREPVVDDATVHQLALSLLAGRGFGDTGARAYYPPGMSFLLYAWYWCTTPSVLAGQLLQATISTALVWQSLGLARQLQRESVARLAAVMVAVEPTLVVYTATLGYDLLLATVFVLICRLAARRDRSTTAIVTTSVALGGLVGFGTLVKPICLLIPPILSLGWLAEQRPIRRIVMQTGLVIAIGAAVIAPWTVRNARVLGAFVPVSTNGGETLYAANNPHSRGTFAEVSPPPGVTGEVPVDRAFTRAALQWIAANPVGWLALVPAKVAFTWGTSSTIMSIVSDDRLPPTVEAAVKAVLNVAWTALFVLSLVATWRSSPWTGGVGFAAPMLILYIFALHLLFEAASRHHIPVLPLLCLIAASRSPVFVSPPLPDRNAPVAANR